MGGGLATHRLAAAVSDAGGLGTIGLLGPAALRAELGEARRLTSGPVAVNLIVPLARREHWAAAAEADAVVTHWSERPRRRVAAVWIDTVGSAEQARAAVAAGADAVIAQGVEAGGHVRGEVAALELLERVRAAVPRDFPVLLAGGIASRGDVGDALDAGAIAAVSGTRFLATAQSGAHPAYKRRLVAGSQTLVTELFGMGWARAPHRVMPNEATKRWLDVDGRGPRWVGRLHALATPLARFAPDRVQRSLTSRADDQVFALSPAAPTEQMRERTVETHPLYAGATVSSVAEIGDAGRLVAELTP
jgi:NAD(P)H-dependent flavin oxidoreductase YrpB (nitropropane dioxygenase family)